MSAQRFAIQSSTAQTANGNSAQHQVSTGSMLALFVDLTAVSGAFDLWLQGSSDGGTTWFDLAADLVTETADSATEVTSTTDTRDIADGETAVGKWAAIFKHLPVDFIRIKWRVTTSATFSVLAVAK